MRKFFALAAIIGLTSVMMPMAQAADQDDASLCSYCWEKGSFTQDNPEASHVLLFPVRATSAVIGAPVGLVVGAGKGAEVAVTQVSKATFEKIGDGNDAGHPVAKALVYGPAGIVGTAIALPLGITFGAIGGTFKGIAKGYMWPDTF